MAQKKHGCTPAQIALAWLLGRYERLVVIPGTRSIARLEENCRAAHIALPHEDLRSLTPCLRSRRFTASGTRRKGMGEGQCLIIVWRRSRQNIVAVFDIKAGACAKNAGPGFLYGNCHEWQGKECSHAYFNTLHLRQTSQYSHASKKLHSFVSMHIFLHIPAKFCV